MTGWRPDPGLLGEAASMPLRQLQGLAEIADTLKRIEANTKAVPSSSDAKSELRTIGGWEECFKTADADDLARTRADLVASKDHLEDALSMLKRAHMIMGQVALPSTQTMDDFRADVAPLIKSIESWLVVR